MLPQQGKGNPMGNISKFEQYLRTKARRSDATIDAYLGVVRKYANFCRGKGFTSPQEAVSAYLSTFGEKSASYQKSALNALAGRNGFYAAHGVKLGKLPHWVKAKDPTFVPTWVTLAECDAICRHLTEPWEMMCRLMIGAGLRIGEVVSLRWRDLDFERMTITVKQGKGNKDRITFLPQSLVDPLRLRYKRCRALWQEDRAGKRPGVEIPRSVANKSPRAGEDWALFFVFPAAGESTDKRSRITRRHHIHKKSIAKALRVAVRRAGIAKRITCHSFRHGFATAYLMSGGNICELRDLLGHQSIQTTEVYLHCIPHFTDRVGSPLDQRPTVVPFERKQPARKEASA